MATKRARQKKTQRQVLTQQQMDVCRIYREGDAVSEFIFDQANPSPDIDDIDQVIPTHEDIVLRAMWESSFMYLCASRRLCKTFCIGNFMAACGAMLSGLHEPIRIGIYSGSLRQVGLNFAELGRAVDRSTLLQSMTVLGPKQTTDGYIWELMGWEDENGKYYEGVKVEGFPLGAQRKSSTSRGLGFTILIMDEFQMVPESSYAAIFPTSATSTNPMEDVRKEMEAAAELKRVQLDADGLWTPPDFNPMKNRLILAGTAYWQFIPAYKVFADYMAFYKLNTEALTLLDMLDGRYPEGGDGMPYRRQVARVVGNLPTIKLRDRFSPLLEEAEPLNGSLSRQLVDYLRLDWSDTKYSAFQLPMTVAPQGWYKKDYIEATVRSMPNHEVQMEFFAKWLPDSDGPFPASLLENASNKGVSIELRGDGHHSYIIGVDPATAKKFGVVVGKVVDEGDRTSIQIVYVREYDVSDEALGHIEQVKILFRTINAFWPCKVCVIDQGGGGISIAQTMAHPVELGEGIWGTNLGQPALCYDNDLHIGMKGQKVNWVLPMPNNMVTEVNNRMKSFLQSGVLQFAGQDMPTRMLSEYDDSGEVVATNFDEADIVRDDMRKLKSQMQQLIMKPAGDGVKYDLPTDPSSPQHVHDLWSAATLMVKGLLEMVEGNVLLEAHTDIPDGMWAEGNFWS